MAFSFGGNQPTSTSQFTLDQQPTQTTSSGFTFGTNAQTPGTGFLFGATTGFGGATTGFGATTTITTTAAGSTPVISFGQTPSFGMTPASTPSSIGFGFPASSASTIPFGGFKAATTTMSTVPGSLSFGGATTGSATTPSSAGFAFGKSTASATTMPTFSVPASTAPTQGWQLGGATPLGLGGFSMAPSTTTSAPSGITSFATSVTSSASNFAAPSTFAIPSVTPATTEFNPVASLGLTVTTVAGLNFSTSMSSSQGQPKPTSLPSVSVAPLASMTAATTELTLPVQPSTTGTNALSFGTSIAPTFTTISTTSLTSTTAASETAIPPGKSTTFSQLEESINKWNVELEEQERIFLSQATQVNAWDRLLVSNGEKITALSESVERVKLEQQRLDHELDFIVAQQRELEELLNPLEKSVDASPSLSIQQHADLEREHTYHLAENVDGQLKRMSEDIKKIIEHLNTANHEDENEPMQQISKILNAHMDALQWIDHNTGMLQKKMDEVTKTLETTRKDQEKSYKIGGYD